MSGKNKTLYSQGLNFGSFITDGVDPRTGQFTCTISIFKAPAEARNCPPLNLTLTYNPLNQRNVGLGLGWSFNLSSYKDGLLYLSTGEHYQVQLMGEELEVKDKKLESFKFQESKDGGYQIVYKNGLVETLSDLNKYDTFVPVELRSSTGQCLALGWTTVEGRPQLSNVSHQSEVLLDIDYSDLTVTSTRAPGTDSACITTIEMNEAGWLAKLQPPEGARKWSFDYNTFGQTTCLTTVTDPSGLVNRVVYTSPGHRLPAGAPWPDVPYVRKHTVQPGDDQPDIVTRYRYSSTNFLGYEGVENWKEGEDNLYGVEDADYQYTTVSAVDGGGPTTKYTYNRFHLLVESTREQGSAFVRQAVEYHAEIGKSFTWQQEKFQLPKTIETRYEYRGAEARESRTEATKHDYDKWGNPISETDKNGVRTEREFYPPEGETREESVCPADPYGFSRYVKRETVWPSTQPGFLPAPTHTQHYNYRRLPATGPEYFVAIQDLQLRDATRDGALLSTRYGYFEDSNSPDYGRLKSQATSLLQQAPIRKEWSYNYANTNGQVDRVTKITATTTYDQKYITKDVTYSLWSGLVLAQTNAQGVRDQFEYDKMDRLVKATASSNSTDFKATQEYQYFFIGRGVGSYTELTDCKGLKTRQKMDGLGRLRRVERQDDGNESFLVIEERTYNNLGQCTEVTTIDWTSGKETERRSKMMDYDDWGQVRKTTETSGGKSLSAMLSVIDPVHLTRTEGVEGQGQTKTTSNLFGRANRVELLSKGEGDACQVYSKTAYDYDGLGRLVKETDNSGNTKQYQLDDYNRVAQTTWPDGSIVKTLHEAHTTRALPVAVKVSSGAAGAAEERLMGHRSLDGLNRVLSQTVGGRTIKQAYDGVSPGPSTVTTPVGDTNRLAYNIPLENTLARLESPDEKSTYEYDKQTASLLHMENPYSATDYKYLRSGPLKAESIKIRGKTLSTDSSHSLAGKLLSYTNVHGQEQTRIHDGFGRLTGLRQGSVTATLDYDESSRLVSSHVVDEATKKSLTIRRGYDEFGREITRDIFQDTETVICQLRQVFNELGLVTRRLVKDGGNTVLRDESFTYDACQRLVSYQCTGSQPPVDESGKPVKRQLFVFDAYQNIAQVSATFQDGSENKRSYTFGDNDPTQLVQITNTNRDYPAKINLSYDENGRLVQDEQGRKLEYNSQNALVCVSDATDKTILSKYHYDAAGRLVSQEAAGKTTYFFYRDKALVAMIMDGATVSFLSDGIEYWGQISQADRANSAVQLWATDEHQSVLAWVDASQPTMGMHSQRYTPYGFDTGGCAIGFNGQYRDPVTGWYHLGNGYRVYNPVLMRFHTPETLSPFSTGEINPYAYCQGDPINRTDPTGHMSGRTWAIMGVGLLVGLLMGIPGIFTAGSSLAVAVGSLVAGSATGAEIAGAAVTIAGITTAEVATGAGYDLASGNTPTLESIGSDALSAGIGALIGEGIGFGLAKAAGKAVSREIGGVVRAMGRVTRATAPNVDEESIPLVTAGDDVALHEEVRKSGTVTKDPRADLKTGLRHEPPPLLASEFSSTFGTTSIETERLLRRSIDPESRAGRLKALSVSLRKQVIQERGQRLHWLKHQFRGYDQLD